MFVILRQKVDMIAICNKIHLSFSEGQEKAQCQKQKLAEQRREEARVQRQIEVAHKEMERLEKFVNTSVE